MQKYTRHRIHYSPTYVKGAKTMSTNLFGVTPTTTKLRKKDMPNDLTAFLEKAGPPVEIPKPIYDVEKSMYILLFGTLHRDNGVGHDTIYELRNAYIKRFALDYLITNGKTIDEVTDDFIQTFKTDIDAYENRNNGSTLITYLAHIIYNKLVAMGKIPSLTKTYTVSNSD